MRRLIALLAAVCAVGCMKAAPKAVPTPTPRPTVPPAPAGSTVPMGRTIRTSSGSLVTVYSWRLGSNRNVEPGPGGVYETVDVSFCSGPGIEEAASDLPPLFSLDMPDSSRIAPDNLSAPGELRTLGTIPPGACKRGPLVFQVEGGLKPAAVGFDSTPPSHWRVP
jgi:hypothetical protein